MKYVLGIVATLGILVNSSSLRADEGDTLQFSCKLNEPVKTETKVKEYEVEARFRVSNIGNKNIALEYLSKKGEEEFSPIEVVPDEFTGGYQSVLHKLNDQGGDIRLYRTDKKAKENSNAKPKDKKKEIEVSGFRLFGDSDGVDYVDLIVWKNGDYKKGYVRYRADDKKDSWYKTITCTHRIVK